MASSVHANSLSDITQLASNPPRYPRNPTEQRRPSLTLYIARVPGTRDIILSTLKPRLKNVTAEDVASSLYYFHLNTEDDARLLEETRSMIPEVPETPLEKPMPRKPLPGFAQSSLDLNEKVTATSLGPVPVTNVPRRKPVGADITPSESSQTTSTSSRRPLGPRPFLSDTSARRPPLDGVENQPLSSPSHDLTSTPHASSETAQHSSFTDMGSDNNNPAETDSNGFSITAIRRDPSSGAQWNIGIISGNPSTEADRRPKASSHHKKAYDMSIHLETPGYSFFRASNPTSHPEVRAETEHSSGVYQTSKTWGFDRQVHMEGLSFWDRPTKSRVRGISDPDGKHTTRGESSTESSNHGASDFSPSMHDSIMDFGVPEARGYVFQSPWDGRCKFSTGSGGRSLKCKHTLPSPVSASNSAEAIPQDSEVVSELRFNLPSTSLFPSSSNFSTISKSGLELKRLNVSKLLHTRNKPNSHDTRPQLPPRTHPTSYAAMYPSEDEEAPPLPPRTRSIDLEAESNVGVQSSSIPSRTHPAPYISMSTSEDDDREESRLDLSIGQERAGGGNRGKRAKLGKLIIHDEGFKMLDLVICANMGIWWSVWES